MTGAAAWHINADEPDLIDYDMTFKLPAQDALYAPDAYRSSDHDPVVTGLQLQYSFSGFFAPIANPPQLNRVKAGSSVPMKFSLGGDYGVDIVAAAYPQSVEIDCDSGATGAGTATATAGGSALAYDAELDQYVYVWQTDATWAGTCRRFVLRLDDGSEHFADFRLR